LGAQNNDGWELKVTAHDGRTVWVNTPHGKEGEHQVETIVAALEKINGEIFPIRSIARLPPKTPTICTEKTRKWPKVPEGKYM
jgi:hypothetical protein